MIKKWKVDPALTKSFTYLLPVFDMELKVITPVAVVPVHTCIIIPRK